MLTFFGPPVFYVIIFFTQENKNIYFTPVDFQYCQGILSCKRRIVILEIRDRTTVVNVKIK
jgi:hypothetical protein